MGFWGDFLFGSEEPEEPVPVTAALTCPVCHDPSETPHCQAVGCTWRLCVPCGLVLARSGTRRWNGPPK